MDSLLCPVCVGTRLETFDWKDVTVDVCARCHGVWFDAGEMLRVAQSDSARVIDIAFKGEFEPVPLGKSMREAVRRCPVDTSDLERHEWGLDSGIAMDWCPLCGGTWLDAGELEGYVQALQRIAGETEEIRAQLRQGGLHADFQPGHAASETTAAAQAAGGAASPVGRVDYGILGPLFARLPKRG